MLLLIIISTILITISGASKAICDVSAINGSIDKLSPLNRLYWRKSISSVSKYKNNDPKQGEKFFGSTTFLIFLTDAWHLFDFIRDISLIIGVIIYIQIGLYPWLILLIYPIRQIVFELSYKWFRKV